MHANKTLPKLGAKRLGGNVLGGNGIGGETTRVWGGKRLRVKTEVKRLGGGRGERLGGEMACYHQMHTLLWNNFHYYPTYYTKSNEVFLAFS